MHVTVEVVGEGTAEYDLPDDATYADLIREAGYHPSGEASALVDGSPVPGDRLVDAESVRLLRLIKGRIDGRRRVSGEGDPSDSPDSPDNIEIRTASPDDRLDILRVLGRRHAGDRRRDRRRRDRRRATHSSPGLKERTRSSARWSRRGPKSDRVHVDAVARPAGASQPRIGSALSSRRDGAARRARTPRVRSSPPSSIRN